MRIGYLLSGFFLCKLPIGFQQYRWSSRQRLKYVSHSIITGPRFLSDRQTIKCLSFFIFFKQVYCNLLRFDFPVDLLQLTNSLIFYVNNCSLFSISLEAGGGFQGKGM